ncbi:MAG: hypothetical protein R3A52_17820 [Polyangiales bacterium]
MNVHDVLALDARTLLAARYNALARGDRPLLGEVVRTLDLTLPGGHGDVLQPPEALARVGDAIWLTLTRLDDPFAPRQPGVVLRLDAAATSVLDATPLPRPNPSWDRCAPRPRRTPGTSRRSAPTTWWATARSRRCACATARWRSAIPWSRRRSSEGPSTPSP